MWNTTKFFLKKELKKVSARHGRISFNINSVRSSWSWYECTSCLLQESSRGIRCIRHNWHAISNKLKMRENVRRKISSNLKKVFDKVSYSSGKSSFNFHLTSHTKTLNCRCMLAEKKFLTRQSAPIYTFCCVLLQIEVEESFQTFQPTIQDVLQAYE